MPDSALAYESASPQLTPRPTAGEHSSRPSIAVQKIFAWSGVALAVGFLVGWGLIAGYMPPSHPQDSVKSILDFYTGDTTLIRLGLLISMTAAALNVPFYVAVSAQLRRIEGRRSLISDAQMIAGGIFALEFIFPLMIWQAAAYRPELDPVITYRLHDLGWLLWLGVVSTVMLQAILIGWLILRDRRPQPVFPRWVGYTSIWCALLWSPGGLIVFFKSGPLAWNGVLAWWVLIVAFVIWMGVLVYSLLRHAIPHEERELAGQAD